MFKIDHYIVYGLTGICRVKSIGYLTEDGFDKSKLYYTLEPLHTKGCAIYTPVENNKVRMRDVISKEEAKNLMHDIPALVTIDIYDDKRSEPMYREALKLNDCHELLQILKVLKLREIEKGVSNKKLSAIDKKYLDLITNNLAEEISLVLEIPRDKTEVEILEKMRAADSFSC
ncbi:MAG: hypothetical protein K0R05_4144 [Anaerocolumna sp.]|jgi:CarD family transcriptional regulator|nr:hypothetical protein [Anaerocolumna sp.]